ncbi:MAG: hypothetical protein V5A61_05535 [Haloarculaceae archaeon]
MVRPPGRGRAGIDGDDRGQSYTLESIVAGVVVLSAVVFAIQATAVTPLSVSTASQHVENQERAVADTLLAQAARNGTLRSAVLYWNPDNRTFVDATAEGYLGEQPGNAFGDQLDRVFGDSEVAVNVYVGYDTANGLKRRTMVYQGTPSDNAVSASQSLVLMDEDTLSGPYAGRTLNGTAPTADAFYAPDVAPSGSVYNVVEVRIVAWRI